MIKVTDNWRSSHPGGAVGLLSMEIDRSRILSAELDQKRVTLEKQLREQYKGIERAAIRQLPVMDAYTQYYKRFKKSYHVLLQLDSICNKHRSIPHTDTLVQAMFMAEMKSFILTAGHDLDQIQGNFILESSTGDEVYTLLRGEKTTCKPGDMVTVDSQGVFCSIIYGQDFRTQITNETSKVLYVVYVPPGIDIKQIEFHLQDLENNVNLAFTKAQTTFCDIFFANPASSFH